jgi:hypothetical protein
MGCSRVAICHCTEDIATLRPLADVGRKMSTGIIAVVCLLGFVVFVYLNGYIDNWKHYEKLQRESPYDSKVNAVVAKVRFWRGFRLLLGGCFVAFVIVASFA